MRHKKYGHLKLYLENKNRFYLEIKDGMWNGDFSFHLAHEIYKAVKQVIQKASMILFICALEGIPGVTVNPQYIVSAVLINTDIF